MRKSLNFIFDLVILLSTTVVLIDGQCNVDANCWSYSVGCTLANAFPFERKSPSTCEECMQMCRKRRQGQLPYLCQSAVYDSNYQTCDLFAVGAYFPYSLTPCPGRTYLCPLNNAQCGAPTPAPAAVDCPAGQTAVMVYFKDSSPASPVSGGSTFAAASQDECLKFCQINQDKSGNPAPCKVAQFQNGQCTVGPNVATGNSAATIQNAVGSYYYEKQCLPSSSVGTCTSILMDPKHIIVGFNKKTVDASTYAQCLQACLDAQTNLQMMCSSGQYFSDTSTQNCVLNSETSSTQPDKYTTVPDPVIYFEPKCTGSGSSGVISSPGTCKFNSDARMLILKNQDSRYLLGTLVYYFEKSRYSL